MIHKPIDSITDEDIDALVSNAVSESRMLDYKECLPGNSDGEKYGCPCGKLLRQAFDALWQASGFERSPSYDLNGDWKKRKMPKDGRSVSES
jgi:hypothetical protein